MWGNIVFGGIAGLAVDAISGGLYNLTPNQIQGQMLANGVTQQGKPQRTSSTKDGLFIAVVLRADPSWQRVGSLEPLAR